jgi:signal peptidase I
MSPDPVPDASQRPRVNGRPTGRPALPGPAWTSQSGAGRQPNGRGAFRTNGSGFPRPAGLGPPDAEHAPEPPAAPLAWVDEPTAPGIPELDGGSLPEVPWEQLTRPAAWPAPAPAPPAQPGAATPPGGFWPPRPAPRQLAAPPRAQWQAPPATWGAPAPRPLPAGPGAYPGGPPVRPRPRRPGSGEVQLAETRVERYGDGYGRRRAHQHRAAFVAELPVLVLAAVVLAVLVKGFLVQAFYIPSRSMEPTLEVGDRVVVNRLSYRLGVPKRGQVVVFLRPTGERVAAPDNALSWVRRAVAQGLGSAPPGNEDLIKRVIAGPGDVVQGSHGRVWLNGSALIEPYLRPGTRTSDFGPVRVPAGHYWVMGDNREDSSDSRFFGPIPHSTLVGRATGTVWPLPHFTLL